MKKSNARLGAALAASALLAAVAGCAAAPRTGRPPSPPSPAPSYETAGLAVLVKNTIRRADGTTVTLALPSGVKASSATEVPDGFLVETEETNAGGLWFVGTSGAPRKLGQPYGNSAVSPDGRTLVVTGLDGDDVVAYRLPDLTALARNRFSSGMGPIVDGLTANGRVLLAGAQGSPGASTAAVWDLATNTVRPSAAEAWTWGVSTDGHALRRVDPPGTTASGKPIAKGGCLDYVALTDTLPTARTGLCTEVVSTIVHGNLSPDGSAAVLSTEDSAHQASLVLVSTADVHNGQWKPVSLTTTAGPATFEFWLTDGTFVMSAFHGDEAVYSRCTVSNRCTTLAIPAGGRLIPPG